MKAVPGSRYIVFSLLVVLGCAVDLATKRWTFDWLGSPDDRTLARDCVCRPDAPPREHAFSFLVEHVFDAKSPANEAIVAGTVYQGSISAGERVTVRCRDGNTDVDAVVGAIKPAGQEPGQMELTLQGIGEHQLSDGDRVYGPYCTWWLRADVAGIQADLNEGALFGIGQGKSYLFAIISLLVCPGIIAFLFWGGAARGWLLTVALGCVTAGILGNLFDRLGLPGLVWNSPGVFHQAGDRVYAVRDWILVMIGHYHWPNFNVADSMLVSGAALLAWYALWTKPAAKSP